MDAEAVANGFGLVVVTWPFHVLQEMQVGGVIAVARRLDQHWRRWVIAHAIGHHLLHPGNHLRMREQGLLSHAVEQEAEESAGALLVDAREALGLGISELRCVARHFGVPEEMVRLHGHPTPGLPAGAEALPTHESGARRDAPDLNPAPGRQS